MHFDMHTAQNDRSRTRYTTSQQLIVGNAQDNEIITIENNNLFLLCLKVYFFHHIYDNKLLGIIISQSTSDRKRYSCYKNLYDITVLYIIIIIYYYILL